MIVYYLGILLLFESVMLLLPAMTDMIYGEGVFKYYIITALLSAIVGFSITRIKTRNRTIYSREGLITVALGWIVLSLFGAIPMWLSGEFPTYIDAFFETVSGFTTTGASVLSNVEALSHATLLWRSFTHWVGGMGVLVFILAITKLTSGGSGIYLMKAESPGHDVSRIVPSTKGTAKLLYVIYVALTVLEIIILLCLGMPLFETICTSFGTAGTGGFGFYNDSFASFSPAIQLTVGIFMMLFGVNFSCYYLIIAKRFREFWKNEELRFYLAIMLSSSLVIAINILNRFGNFGEALLQSYFQVSSVMTTTGFTTADFNSWPELSRTILLLIMCIGACAGSTGGGLKVARFIILGKVGIREIRYATRPKEVRSLRLSGKAVSDQTVRNVCSFFVLYVMVFVVSLILISFDKMDFVSNISGVIATLNNIGPGLEVVGATGNYGSYSAVSKLIFSANMLLGRLELLPLFVLFSPRTWKR